MNEAQPFFSSEQAAPCPHIPWSPSQGKLSNMTIFICACQIHMNVFQKTVFGKPERGEAAKEVSCWGFPRNLKSQGREGQGSTPLLSVVGKWVGSKRGSDGFSPGFTRINPVRVCLAPLQTFDLKGLPLDFNRLPARDACHFRHFRPFSGSYYQSPCFTH